MTTMLRVGTATRTVTAWARPDRPELISKQIRIDNLDVARINDLSFCRLRWRRYAIV